jgi:hypothetical protein
MKVTIIGTGNIGRAIGSRALAGGHEVSYIGTHLGKAQGLADEMIGEGAVSASEDGLRTPPAGRFEELRALPVSVWIDADHVRRIEFEHESRQLMLELWDFGVSTDEFDWSRLPTFRSPGFHGNLRRNVETPG